MIAYIKSLAWIDYFYLLLTDPRKLSGLIEKEEMRALPMGFICLACVSITEILSLSLLGEQSSFFYYKITYGWILLFLMLSFKVAVLAGLIDIVAQFFGLPGYARRLIDLLSLALFPRVLLLPLVFVFRVFNFAPVFFYALFSTAFAVWSSLIVVQGISEMHSLPFPRSIMIFLLPFVFTALISFFILILLVAQGVGYLSSF